jgi:diguanylate cyclase (GGDEF)-like protein
MNDETWLNELTQLQALIESTLYSPLEFTKRLKHLLEDHLSPFEAFEITCKATDTEEYYVSGKLGSPIVTASKRRDFNVGTGEDVVECSIYYLEKRGADITNQIHEAVEQLFKGYLQPDARVKGFGLLDAQTGSIKKCLQPTLLRMTNHGIDQSVFVVYIDLDDFKQINDKLGHPQGDAAIRHVAACIRNLGASDDVVGLRKGGDEFALIAQGVSLATLVTALERLHQSVSARLFGEQYSVGFTAGAIRVKLDDLANCDFESLLSIAEGVTKDSGTKEKKRGTVSIAQEYVEATRQLSPVEFAMLEITLLRARLLCERPFGNELLNVVSHVASGVMPTMQLDGSVFESLATRLGIRFGNYHFSDLICGRDLATCNVPAVAFALAISHGRLKSLTLAASDAGVESAPTNLSEPQFGKLEVMGRYRLRLAPAYVIPVTALYQMAFRAA